MALGLGYVGPVGQLDEREEFTIPVPTTENESPFSSEATAAKTWLKEHISEPVEIQQDCKKSKR